jgi:hypothetical protein
MVLGLGGREIETTPEHPFWVRDKGWTAAGEIEPGEELRSHDGQWIALDSKQLTDSIVTVYNMRVAEDHTYFVGSPLWGFSVWAHNSCDLPVHGQSRLLIPSDLGLTENAVKHLGGRITFRGQQMIVRIENIVITENMRGQQSLASMINRLKLMARQGGMNRLVIEGVQVGNNNLARILVRRYGGIYTPQRTILINITIY